MKPQWCFPSIACIGSKEMFHAKKENYRFSGCSKPSSKRQWIQFPASVGRRSTALMQCLPCTS